MVYVVSLFIEFAAVYLGPDLVAQIICPDQV